MTKSTAWQQERQQAQQQLVTFRLGVETYGVEISGIQEVIHHREVTQMPNAPEFIDGVLELRDQVIPVVDLKRRLGILDPAPGRRRIVILDLRERLLGVIVDDISRVLWVTASQCEPVPEAVIGDAGRNCIRALAKTEDGLVIVMDPQRILSGSERRQLRQLDTSAG